jgi:hypothetical protein
MYQPIRYELINQLFLLGLKGVRVDISASNIILFGTPICRKFSAKFFHLYDFSDFEIRVEIIGKINED